MRGRADGAGLPTHTVADAGRTQVPIQGLFYCLLILKIIHHIHKSNQTDHTLSEQVAAGSKTVLVIGPGIVRGLL